MSAITVRLVQLVLSELAGIGLCCASLFMYYKITRREGFILFVRTEYLQFVAHKVQAAPTFAGLSRQMYGDDKYWPI
jgi:hypothetical protein